MALTAQQVADLQDRYQRFTAQIVAFSAIPWTGINFPATGAITWYPLCLISPRFSYGAVGGTITLYATDSYIRPFTACTSWAWSKVSGNGSIADNLDGTATVTIGSGEAKFQCVVKENAGASESTTGYAFVYGSSVGNATALISEIGNFSGDFESGEWAADVTFRGSYSGVLANDGRNQPILMHVNHYWDGSENTFGGYRRHQNTFLLLCRYAEAFEKYGDYYTRLRLETPAYALKKIFLTQELKFKSTAGAGFYSTANLTPTDAAYFLMRHGSNYHQYFNVSLWNNSTEITNFNVRADTSLWDAARETHEYNFGVCYMDRWSNLNGKPDPRYRKTEWDVICDPVFDEVNPLTAYHFFEYNIVIRRQDDVRILVLQSVLPDMTVVEEKATESTLAFDTGDTVVISSLVADSSVTLAAWADAYFDWHARPYDVEFSRPMGHELNPGDTFYFGGASHPLAGGIGAGEWLCMSVDYEFDFGRGQWTRRFSAGIFYDRSPI